MSLTPIKTPLVAKKMFPNYVWDIPTTNKAIYLTFDDGPISKITEWVLDILKLYQAKATFFCIGNNIEKHPEIFERIVNEGHVIGNHTQNHAKGWKTKTTDYLENIAKAQQVITSNIPNSKFQKNQYASVNLFRPPYGQIKPKQGRKLLELGYKIIMWDVLSFDWDKTVTEETCLKNVISKTTAGSIVVFHDSIKASKNMQYALPKVLEHFTNEGYQFKAINLSKETQREEKQ